MRRSTDFQIQEALCLASVGIFWSLCFYEDNHWTGQWLGRGLLLAGGSSLQLLGKWDVLGPWCCWELLKVRGGVYCCHVKIIASPIWTKEDSTNKGLSKPRCSHCGKRSLMQYAICYRRVVQEYFSHRGHKTDQWVKMRTTVGPAFFIPNVLTEWAGI